MAQRTVRELLGRSLALYRHNLGLVLALTLPIVVIVIGLTALGLGELGASYRSSLPSRDIYFEAAASELVTAPLVTSVLARWVALESRGERLAATELLASGLEAFPAVLLVVVVWLAVSAVGFLLLIFPGIYTFVSWYFVVQAVVIDGQRGLAPISRSSALVRGNWWRSAGVGLAFLVPSAIATALISAAFAPLASATNSAAVLVAAEIVADALTLPFLAIGATLYYLELRARAGAPPVARF
jgi:hypothetical protein